MATKAIGGELQRVDRPARAGATARSPRGLYARPWAGGETYEAAGVSIGEGRRRRRTAPHCRRIHGCAGGSAPSPACTRSTTRRSSRPRPTRSGRSSSWRASVARFGLCGADLAAHCINDVIACGADPLFFLDYVAANRIDLEVVTDLVEGAAEVCRRAGVALVGGETAELPGIYREKELDFAGTCVGRVDRARLLDGSAVEEGDAVVGLPSAGVHANGFTLVRRVLEDEDYTGDDLLARRGSTSTRCGGCVSVRTFRACHGWRDRREHRACRARRASCRDRVGLVGAPIRVRLARPARRGGRAPACLQPRDRVPRRDGRSRRQVVIGSIVRS